jgi:hypothetical protein
MHTWPQNVNSPPLTGSFLRTNGSLNRRHSSKEE